MEAEFKKRVGKEYDSDSDSDSDSDKTCLIRPEDETTYTVEEPDMENEDHSNYLGDDPPIHGQGWGLISFAQTSLDVFSKIELQMVMEFLLYLKNNEPYSPDEKEEQKKALDLLLECPDKNNPETMLEYRTRLNEQLPKYYAKYLSEHRVLLGEIAKRFLGKNKTDRAFKLRGVFKTRNKAQSYIKDFLQKKVDNVVPIHLCPVGKWLPWNPTLSQVESISTKNKELDELINGAIEEQHKSANSIEIRRQAARLEAKRRREEYYRKKEAGELPDDLKELDEDTINKVHRLESKIMECSLEEQEEMREEAEKRYAQLTKQPYKPGILARIFDRHKTIV